MGCVRNLYTSEFLSLTIVKEKQDLLKQELKERGQKHALVVQNVTDLIRKNELLSQDMTELILSSRSKNDLREITELFQSYVKNSTSDTLTGMKRNAGLFKDLVAISHIQHDMEAIHPLLKVILEASDSATHSIRFWFLVDFPNFKKVKITNSRFLGFTNFKNIDFAKFDFTNFRI